MTRLVCACFVFSSWFAGWPARAQTLPDGPGKDLFAAVCGSCHALDLATSQRKTREGWQATVDSMAAKGAAGSGEQFDRIAENNRPIVKESVAASSSKTVFSFRSN